MSAPVTTAMTPGAALASSVLIAVIGGVGEGAAHHGEVQHAGQLDVVGPAGAAGDEALVLLAGARLADLARRRVGGVGRAVLGDRHDDTACEPHRAGRLLHGLDDVVVAGAAAEVALETLADLLLARVGVVLEDVARLHDHAGSAVAALEGVALVEGLLNRVELAILGEPLDRRHLVAVRLDGEDVARLHARAVEVHGAGTAVARVAPDDGSGLAEALAKVLDQKGPGLDLVGVAHPVDGHIDTGHACRSSCHAAVDIVDFPTRSLCHK